MFQQMVTKINSSNTAFKTIIEVWNKHQDECNPERSQNNSQTDGQSHYLPAIPSVVMGLCPNVTGWQPSERLLMLSQQLNLPCRDNQMPGWYLAENDAWHALHAAATNKSTCYCWSAICFMTAIGHISLLHSLTGKPLEITGSLLCSAMSMSGIYTGHEWPCLKVKQQNINKLQAWPFTSTLKCLQSISEITTQSFRDFYCKMYIILIANIVRLNWMTFVLYRQAEQTIEINHALCHIIIIRKRGTTTLATAI